MAQAQQSGDAELAVVFKAMLSDFEASLERAKAKIGSFSASSQRAADQGIGALSKAAGLLGLNLGAVTSALSAAGLLAFAKQATDAAAGVERAARAASLSYGDYTKLDAALRSQGVGAEASAAGLANFNRVVSLARLKTGELYETLKQIAPALADQLTKTNTTEQAFQVYAEAIRRMVRDEDRLTLATKAFGDAGIDLLPALSKGAAGVAEMTEKSKAMLTVNEDAAKAAKSLKSEIGLLWDSISADAANNLKGVNTSIAENLQALRVSAEHGGSYIEAIKRAWNAVGDATVKAAEDAVKWGAAVRNLGSAADLIDKQASRFANPNIAPAPKATPAPTVSADSWSKNMTVRDLMPQQKPDYRGVDAINQAMASLVAARGEQFRAIQLEGAMQIEQARRLLQERVLDEKQFATIRETTNAATDAKLVALRRDTNSQLRDLAISAFNAEENGLAALSLEYERDLEKYQVMLKQKLITEQQFATARENINRAANVRIGEEISKLGDKVREQTKGYADAIESSIGNALNGTFTSGKDAARAFFTELLQGLQRATMQALILKPIMEALTGKSTNSGAVGDATGGILGGIGRQLSGIFGSAPSASSWGSNMTVLPATAAAEGGDVRAGVATQVNERAGRPPEVFVPDTAGRVVPAERAASSAGTTSTTNVYNIDARNADTGVEARIRQVLIDLERSRPTAAQAIATQRRKFPLRAA